MSTKSMITACQKWYMKSAHYFYLRFLKTKSINEDEKRSEGILTLLLFIALIINAFFEIVLIFLHLSVNNYEGIPLTVFSLIFAFFILLFIAARKGYHLFAGYCFVFLILASTIYGSYMWGASLPMGLLSYGLVVTIASIVINSRFGFIIALIACSSIVITGLHEHSSQIIPEWKQAAIEKRDVISYGIMIGLTALLSRLSNKEMEKSLKRARTSEQALKEERDNLEITVQERTRALRESERERMRELYRFAEFGKLSGGIFHDLLNPLTAVSLSVEKLSADSSIKTSSSEEAVRSLKTAVSATKKMEQFMATVKKQIQSNDMRGAFSLNEEIEDAIELIKHKAIKTNTSIIFDSAASHQTYGNPLKLNQVITNLLINAIDAGATEIIVSLSASPQLENKIVCIIKDNGSGMPPDISKNIFTPFYTTKEKGIGLGLSTTKDIVEEHFGGSIDCQSSTGNQNDSGTSFTIILSSHDFNSPSVNRIEETENS